MKLTTTGIPGLDAQIGGFPAGSTILFLSEPSNATSIFAEQFAAGGILKGEHAAYFSLERPLQEIRENLAKMEGMTPDKAEKVEIIDRYAPISISAGAFSQGDKPIKIAMLKHPEKHRAAEQDEKASSRQGNVIGEIDALVSSGKMKAPYRFVLESLSSVLMQNDAEKAMGLLARMVFKARKDGGVNLVMMTKGIHSPQLEYAAKHIADGVLEIGIERRGFGIYSYIMITKMRGVIDSTKLLLYKETEKGLWLESTRRVF